MSPDDEVLAMLHAVPEFHEFVEGDPETPGAVFDGSVEVDETKKVIAVPLPYVVFWSSPGYDNDARFCGGVAGSVVEFRVQAIGATRWQAKWALGKARDALSRKRINGNLIRREDNGIRVTRDDDYQRPGGDPLFWCADDYSVVV